jgi:F0F1-type ATP synthase membrane subunit b/b'
MGRPRKEPLTENQKIAKAIGPDAEEMLRELEAADTEELNKRVAQASQAISDTKEELNKNLEYVQAKEDVKLLSSGLKEVKKRQNAIIKVCLNLRRDRGVA